MNKRVARRTWEVSHAGNPPVHMTRNQILEALLCRKIGLVTYARSASDQQWLPISSLGEFADACPDIHWDSSNKKIDSVGGIVSAASDPKILMAVANRLRSNPSYPELDFFIPLLTNQPCPPFMVSATLYRFWEGVFAGIVLESHNVRSSMSLHGYMIAVNLTSTNQAHALVSKKYPIPEQTKMGLSFNLPPWSWTANKLLIPPSQRPGDYTIEFRSTSTAAKAGKAFVTTALTLGMFTYIPGHKGFKLSFHVLTPQEENLLNNFEAAVLHAAGTMFTSEFTDRHNVSKNDYLARFREYLWSNPDRMLTMMSKFQAQSEAVLQMINRFKEQQFDDTTDDWKNG